MQACDVCGNVYDKAFSVTQGRDTFTFDSIECAAVRLAPSCSHCDCRILGHGVENEEGIFCCAHCARKAGEHGVRDCVEGGEEARAS